MTTRNVFATCLILLLTSVSTTAVAEKKSSEPQTQYRVKDQADPANTNVKATTGVKLPAAQGLPDVKARKIQEGLSQPAADHVGAAAETAAAAEQARGLREAQQALKEMKNVQGVKNLGEIDNLDGLIGNRNDPSDRLGKRHADQAGNNPYGQPEGFKDPLAGHGNRNTEHGKNPYAPSGPRDAGGIGLVSQGGGSRTQTDSYVEGDTHYYAKDTFNEDGSSTHYLTGYDATTGEFRSYDSVSYDADMNVTRERHLDRVGTTVDYRDGSSTPIVQEVTTNADGSGEVNIGRELGTEKDPPARDPNFAGIPTDDPYASGDPGPCRLPGSYCEDEAKRKAGTSRRPTLVNPGDPDLVRTNRAPQLAIDKKGLVTNPATDGGPAGGFNPPAGWQPGENSTPGAMPPQPGSKP